MRTALRFFYRHVYVTGLEHIPAQGPVIIIANHPSSLMDAALLGILLQRKAWFFTRGDVFINRPVQKILYWLHMLPVHPYEKGRSGIDANSDSFSAGQAILSNNGIIVFFPESTSHVEHQLWPFRKGVFRLAFQTMAAHDFSFSLPIVPIGITYDHPVAGRKCVQVQAGPPLQAADYTHLYQSNPAAALLRIAKDAQDGMTAQVLHIIQHDRCAIAEKSILINNNNQPRLYSAWKIGSRQKLEQEQVICHHINKMTAPALAALQQRQRLYFDALAGHGVDDSAVTSLFSFARRRNILLWVGYPIYLLGLLLNGFPVFVARRIADKKVTRVDFYTWVYTVFYALLYPLWFILLVVAALFFDARYAVMLVVLMPLTGLFSYYYIDWREEARQYRRLRRISAQDLAELKRLRTAAALLSA